MPRQPFLRPSLVFTQRARVFRINKVSLFVVLPCIECVSSTTNRALVLTPATSPAAFHEPIQAALVHIIASRGTLLGRMVSHSRGCDTIRFRLRSDTAFLDSISCITFDVRAIELPDSVTSVSNHERRALPPYDASTTIAPSHQCSLQRPGSHVTILYVARCSYAGRGLSGS